MRRLVLLGALMAAGCAQATELRLASLPVRSGPFEARLEVVGEAQPVQNVGLAVPAQLWGTIETLVPEGTRVKAGDVVCRIQVRDFRERADQASTSAALQRLEVARQQADRPYEERKIGHEEAGAYQEMRDKLLDFQAFARGPQPDEAAQARADEAIARLRLSLEDLAKQRTLYEQGYLAREALRTAELENLQLQGQLERARLHLSLLSPRAQVDVYERKRIGQELARSRYVVAREEAQAARHALGFSSRKADFEARENQARSDRLTRILGQAEFRAPIAGVLLYPKLWGHQQAYVGMEVWNGLSFLSIAQVETLKIVAPVGERDVAQIKVGAPVEVRVPGRPGRPIHGRVSMVSQISRELDPRDPDSPKVYDAEIALAEPARELRPEMRLPVRIRTAAASQAISVPQEALFASGKEYHVWLDRGAAPARVPVRPRLWGTDWVTVEGELGERDRVYLLDPTDPALSAPDEPEGEQAPRKRRSSRAS